MSSSRVKLLEKRLGSQYSVSMLNTKMSREYVFNILKMYCEVLGICEDEQENGQIDHHILMQLNKKIRASDMHTIIQMMYSPLANRVPKFRPVYYCVGEKATWQDYVIAWWNDWVVNGFRHRKNQLYLWGPSNFGKTTFVENLLKMCTIKNNENFYDADDENDDDLFEAYIFRPSAKNQKYAFQDWDRSKFNVCIIDDFHVSHFDLCDLKKAIAGEYFVTFSKCDTPKKAIMQVPVIFISNFDAPKDSSYFNDDGLIEINEESKQYRGFSERLFVVEADQAYF